QFIAYSGNSGSSGGPHLHFEVRDAASDEPLNPLPFLGGYISDSRPPQILEIRVIPMLDSGLVNGAPEPKTFPLQTDRKTGRKSLSGEITAWGKIGVALKAYDYMNGVSNTFGPYIITLNVNGKTVYESRMDHFSFDDTRYLNSWIDYAVWRKQKGFFMKSFIEQGNKLPIYRQIQNNGLISIDEERDYLLTYTVEDFYGNKTDFQFTIRGQRGIFPPVNRPNTLKMVCDKTGKFILEDVDFLIPKGNLYCDIYFKYDIKNSMEAVSPVYTLHDYNDNPLHGYCPLKIRVSQHLLNDASKYYIARFTDTGKKIYNKTVYANGWFETEVRDFGDYAVVSDFVPPVITPVREMQWGKTGTVNCRITDADSGIRQYRTEIDGKFYVLNYDAKNNMLSAKLNAARISKGQQHKFRLTVSDNCGNETEYSTTFIW
ncbi:MAG: hypothetical protein LBD45_01815, partial [Bacteroidales bacterium]|nr:hypothetical protein [Bacteroidales bacterium]